MKELIELIYHNNILFHIADDLSDISARQFYSKKKEELQLRLIDRYKDKIHFVFDTKVNKQEILVIKSGASACHIDEVLVRKYI